MNKSSMTPKELEMVEKCLSNLVNTTGLNIWISDTEKTQCVSFLPESLSAIGRPRCLEKPGHKGMHVYSGSFLCKDGSSLFIGMSWGKKKDRL